MAKLSPTAQRSLTNLAAGPCGYWLNALRARKIHGLSIDGLVRRGYATTEKRACADGCHCVGNGDGGPTTHYVITEAGREQLA